MKIDIAFYEPMLSVLRRSLWNIGTATADIEVFEEMKQHTVAALAAPILRELSLPSELFSEWEKMAVKTVTKYYRSMRQQASLPITVPYVILKGTSAAQYYPIPEYRMMGDIDIMTRREDYGTACSMLIDSGFVEVIHPENKRHREFEKKHIMVEVHGYYATLNEPKHAEYLDDLILKSITPTHVLPDLINGLVILEHINQHLEDGLGLRQIIDWMMFVNKCLPDQNWLLFRKMAQNCGLETLAIVTTRICERYLGLPVREWCSCADETLCTQLMNYVLACGNFGVKIADDVSLDHTKTLAQIHSLKSAFSLLQRRGMINWKAAQRYPVLKPFSWLYQLGKYMKMGLTQELFFDQIQGEWKEAQQQKVLFEALGVRQKAKGVVEYKEGEYKKK